MGGFLFAKETLMNGDSGQSGVELSLEDGVLRVALNRPQLHNAMNPEMIKSLFAVFGELRQRDDVRVVVLTDLMQVIDECPKPVVGRINGAAIGGGIGLVSCCDIAVAVERAKFGLSEVRLGLLPAVISPFVLSKIGESNGRELFLTGERFDAHRARRIGLVQHVVAEADLDSAVDERVQQLLQAAPGAQADAKELIRTVIKQPKVETREYTSRLIARRRASDEGREGMSAFLEKRNPDWQTQKHS
jgi:methylglutaconyl-CoA hydratase